MVIAMSIASCRGITAIVGRVPVRSPDKAIACPSHSRTMPLRKRSWRSEPDPDCDGNAIDPKLPRHRSPCSTKTLDDMSTGHQPVAHRRHPMFTSDPARFEHAGLRGVSRCDEQVVETAVNQAALESRYGRALEERSA
ncbi:hypothetical protein [Agrobacterium fabrum]|uniref:hypothetical protein n=1 Tax=Agrobacterium fabrum TaxID=1176649 RepID=UPI00115FF616|nr:hypothetical protein [Agrobacterium fabrum]